MTYLHDFKGSTSKDKEAPKVVVRFDLEGSGPCVDKELHIT